MQFSEQQSTVGKCPICGKPVTVRSTREKKPPYCSRICASQRTHGSRYRGSLSGPMDRPQSINKTKFE